MRDQMFRRSLLVLLLTGSAAAGAHHSFAVFFDDTASIRAMRGEVTAFHFRNPHGVIFLTVKTADGEEKWKIETNSPSILERRGWKRDSLKAGDQITVEGWPARDGTRHMRMRKVTRSDGTVVGIPFDSIEVK